MFSAQNHAKGADWVSRCSGPFGVATSRAVLWRPQEALISGSGGQRRLAPPLPRARAHGAELRANPSLPNIPSDASRGVSTKRKGGKKRGCVFFLELLRDGGKCYASHWDVCDFFVFFFSKFSSLFREECIWKRNAMLYSDCQHRKKALKLVIK